MGLLFLALGLAAYLIIRLKKEAPIQNAVKYGAGATLLLFNAVTIIVAGAKFAIVKLVFQEQAVGFVGSTIYQIAGVNLLVYLWVQFRANSEENHLSRLGDLLGNHLLIFGCISLGLVLFNFQTAEIFFSNSFAFFVTAVTDRLPVAVHLFWWLLLVIFIHQRILGSEKQINWRETLPMVGLGLIPFVFQPGLANLLALLALAVFFALYRKFSRFQKIILRMALAVVIAATLYGQTFRIRSDYKKEIPKILSCELLHVTADALLEKEGAETYADEIAYYQGIANQLRSKHLPQAQIRDEWICES
jgi:hypothetical protein